LAIEKLKVTTPGTDQIPAEFIKSRCRSIRCETHKLVNSIGNKEELPEDWKKLIFVLFISFINRL
jgi:hypothetical protein